MVLCESLWWEEPGVSIGNGYPCKFAGDGNIISPGDPWVATTKPMVMQSFTSCNKNAKTTSIPFQSSRKISSTNDFEVGNQKKQRTK